MTLHKQDLVKRVAAQVGLSDRKTRQVIQAFLDAFVQGLAEEGRIQLRDFGTFSVVERKRRSFIHPITKQPIEAPPKKKIQYIVGKALEKKINTRSRLI